MPGGYYVRQADEKGEMQRHYLARIEDIAAYMFHDGKAEGELFLDKYEGLKLHYNTETGDVNVMPVESLAHINVVYSPEAFQTVIIPVQEAINLLAKTQLLQQLVEFDETIRNILREPDLQNAADAKLSLVTVEKILKRIERFVAPVNDRFFMRLFSRENAVSGSEVSAHQAIYTALQSVTLDAVNSMRQVNELMQKIQESAHQTATPRQSRS